MTFQPDLELREKVFIKIEWEQLDAGRDTDDLWWWKKDKSDGGYFQELPPLEITWEVCAEFLVPFMREKGFDYQIVIWPTDMEVFKFGNLLKNISYHAEIKDDNIALAACKAFMEVEL